MAKKKHKFRVKPFKNPSGAVSWRAFGCLRGKQVRRNFSEKEKAQNEADRLEIEALSADAQQTSRLTRLSAQQLHAAELLFDRANGDVDKVLGMLPMIRQTERKPVKLAAIAWLSEMERSGKRDVTVSVNRYMSNAFFKACTAEFCDEITKADAEAFVFAQDNRESQKDRRQRLGQFMGFCAAQGWLARNFAAELPKIKVERDLPAILSPDEIKTLLEKARTVRIDRAKARTLRKEYDPGSMEMYVMLTAFTGLRPAEARKISRGAFHLDSDSPCIEIGAKMAKVSQCRQIELLEAVRLKLKTGNLKFEKGGRVFFNERLWKKVRKESGLLALWRNDILRHTYASWHYAVFKDINRLAYTMGNSKEVLFSNYIRPMTAAEGKKYLEALK